MVLKRVECKENIVTGETGQIITFALKFLHHGIEMWYCRVAERR